MSLQTLFVTNRNLLRGKDKTRRVFGKEIDRQGDIHFAKATRADKKVIKRYKVAGKIPRKRHLRLPERSRH